LLIKKRPKLKRWTPFLLIRKSTPIVPMVFSCVLQRANRLFIMTYYRGGCEF
jgi:hypothetical protein